MSALTEQLAQEFEAYLRENGFRDAVVKAKDHGWLWITHDSDGSTSRWIHMRRARNLMANGEMI